MRFRTSDEFSWAKYVLAALIIHAAILAVPVTQKASQVVKQRVIDIIVMRQELPPARVEKQVAAPKVHELKVKEQPRVETPPPPNRVVEKREAAPSGGAGNVLDEQIAAQVAHGPATGGGEGVGVAGVNVAGGKIGLGGGGTGSGTGQGTGSVQFGGGGPVEAAFGEPDGPQIVNSEKPEYPFAARRLGKEGRVLLEVFLDDRGKIVKVDVREATDQTFAQSAVDAVRKWKFLPAKRGGSAVASRSILPIRFGLNR
jgi:periplasmic protein TonB